MITIPDMLLRLLLAILAGGLIGLEREYRDKSAGLRTIIFICLGATIFTMLSLHLGGTADPVRIAANIVSGVGFLGAGTIVQSSGRVTGLTTAATIWLAAAVGMGNGSGNMLLSTGAVVLVLVVLWAFPAVERRVNVLHDRRLYQIVLSLDDALDSDIAHLFRDQGLEPRERETTKRDAEVVWLIEARGHQEAHARLIPHLTDDERIIRVTVTS